ncbi:MAG: hypothetical protein FJY73_03945 [Candidatus Eisenbacteria bacterium]|nr:hypothetical protein [Candidatus Eisenbacteria bacterium]
MNTYLLDSRKHAAFLAEERIDPFTREPLRPGDEIVICARDKMAFHLASWNVQNGCPICHCTETGTLPVSTRHPSFRQRTKPRVTEVAERSIPRREARGSRIGVLLLVGAMAAVGVWGVIFRVDTSSRERARAIDRRAIARGAVSAEVTAVNLRRSPGYLGKSLADVIKEVPSGTGVEILNGPTVVDGLPWWEVRCLGSAGWMAERTTSGKKIIARQ